LYCGKFLLGSEDWLPKQIALMDAIQNEIFEEVPIKYAD
jgi:hypothetical protein